MPDRPWSKPAWEITEESGPAADLHAASAAALEMDPARRVVRVLEADAAALVLGSAQPESDFDAPALARTGLEVVRRRSGGGAVIVGPGRVLWVDFLVPKGDPFWDDDVGRAAWWVGELWLEALVASGFDRSDLEVWKGAMVASPSARSVCFAGLGPGEVRLAGKKAVGVSQRRTRRMALFQTAAMLTWVPEEYTAIMSGGDQAGEELAHAVTGLGAGTESRLHAALMDLLMP